MHQLIPVDHDPFAHAEGRGAFESALPMLSTPMAPKLEVIHLDSSKHDEVIGALIEAVYSLTEKFDTITQDLAKQSDATVQVRKEVAGLKAEMRELVKVLKAPSKVVRDAHGKVVGAQRDVD